MANINVVSADEDTQKSTNPDQFANIRTGNPDSADNSGPEADAKLEDTMTSESVSETDSDSDASTGSTSPDSTPSQFSPAETEPAEEKPEPTPAGPDPEPEKPEVPVAPIAAAAGGAASAKVTSGSGAKNSKHLGRLLFEVFLLLVIAGLAYWGYGLMQENDKLTTENKNLVAENSKLNSNPAIIAQKESDTILVAVGKLVKLPAGETPTIANVTDAAAAKKQSAFFVNAQNGDKVLFYVKTGQAILYRPSTNTIVAQGPLTINNTATTNKKQ